MAKTSLLIAQTSKTFEYTSVMLVSLSMILYRKVKYSIKEAKSAAMNIFRNFLFSF